MQEILKGHLAKYHLRQLCGVKEALECGALWVSTLMCCCDGRLGHLYVVVRRSSGIWLLLLSMSRWLDGIHLGLGVQVASSWLKNGSDFRLLQTSSQQPLWTLNAVEAQLKSRRVDVEAIAHACCDEHEPDEVAPTLMRVHRFGEDVAVIIGTSECQDDGAAA